MINPITVEMVVDGGTSTAGPSHGGTRLQQAIVATWRHNESRLSLSVKATFLIYIYIYNMQNMFICAICKICKIDSMQNMQKIYKIICKICKIICMICKKM